VYYRHPHCGKHIGYSDQRKKIAGDTKSELAHAAESALAPKNRLCPRQASLAQSEGEEAEMISARPDYVNQQSLKTLALALAMIITAPGSVAIAQTPPYYPAPQEDYYRPEYPSAPYGYASPSYRSQYGTYPAPPVYTYDPYSRAQQRNNQGVDFLSR
jgi:hypothetical protein